MSKTIKVVSVREHSGQSIESNWRLPCQVITTEGGEQYVNTPQFSNGTFESGKTYIVGIGSTFGKTSQKQYRTASIIGRA